MKCFHEYKADLLQHICIGPKQAAVEKRRIISTFSEYHQYDS